MNSKLNKELSSRAFRTLKSEQHALKSLSRSIPGLIKVAELIGKRKGDIVLTGIGKSGFIAQKIASTLTSLGQRAVFLHPVEAIHGDIGVLSADDVLVALSYSGSSKEVTKLAEYAQKHFAVPLIVFTGNAQSVLAKMADTVVPISIKNEGSPENLAPMASTTSMLVLGDMLASMLAGKNTKKDFARLHPGGSLGLELRTVSESMKRGPIFVKEGDGLQTILKAITRGGLGITAVIDKQKKVTGVITDGDIRRGLLKGYNIAQDFMASNPKTVSAESSLKDALHLMEKHKITSLIVVKRTGQPVGFIHIHNIIEGNVV